MPTCMYLLLVPVFLIGLIFILIFQSLFKFIKRIDDSKKIYGKKIANLSYLIFGLAIIDGLLNGTCAFGAIINLIFMFASGIILSVLIVYFFYSLIIGRR